MYQSGVCKQFLFFWGGGLITAISKSFHIKQINDSYWEAKCWQIFLSQLHKVLQFDTKFELSTCIGLLRNLLKIYYKLANAAWINMWKCGILLVTFHMLTDFFFQKLILLCFALSHCWLISSFGNWFFITLLCFSLLNTNGHFFRKVLWSFLFNNATCCQCS